MTNYKNTKTIELINSMNETWKLDFRNKKTQYKKELNNRHKVVQLVNNGKPKELFEYLKRKGQFLGYTIYEENRLGTNNTVTDTKIKYYYLYNGYYCSIIFNKTLNNLQNYGLEGSEVSI